MLLLLRIIGLIPGGRWLLRKCYAVEHPALEREVFGIRFANPIGLAAGFDHNGEAFRELAALGFGFVEVGTVTPRPQAGNPRPRVFRLPKDNAIINRIGLANRGLEATIRHLRRPHDGVIVGCNIGMQDMGRKVSEEVGIIGYDNNIYASVNHPPITTISFKSMEIGEKAAEILVKLIRGEKLNSNFNEYLYQPSIVERESCLGKGKK